MSKRIGYWRVPLAVSAGLLLAGSLAAAQETPKAASPPSEAPAKLAFVYRLDFVVRELEGGKRINSRDYSLSAKSHEWASLRVGSRVPAYPYESKGDKGIQYQNAGIDIDCRPEERDDEALLSTRFESTSLVAPQKVAEERGSGAVYLGPTFRQVRFTGDALVPLGKPTVIATLDDVATNHRYEIEVTVTKVK